MGVGKLTFSATERMTHSNLPPGLCVSKSACKPGILIHRSKFLSPPSCSSALRGEKLFFNPVFLGVFRSCVSPTARRATGEVQTMHAASNGREATLLQSCGSCSSHPKNSNSRPASPQGGRVESDGRLSQSDAFPVTPPRRTGRADWKMSFHSVPASGSPVSSAHGRYNPRYSRYW